MIKKIFLILILLCPGIIIAEQPQQKEVVQKFSSGDGKYEDPRPGPDEKEKLLWTGKFSIHLSENDIWNGKTLSIKKIEEVPVKNIFPDLKTTASITVPESWDYTDPLPVSVKFDLAYDAREKKTKIKRIMISIQVNLSYMDRKQDYVFEGAYIAGIKGFAGTYSVNGEFKGYFAAVKNKK